MVSENYTQLLLDGTSRFNLSAFSTAAGPTVSLEEDLQTQMMVSTIVAIFFGFIGITGLLGNALVVLVVLSNPQMRSTTNLLIINLAIADLLFVVFCIPFTATDYVLASWPFGELWCKTVQYLIVVTAHASIYTLVLMSLDRFLAVVHPIASMVIRTEKNTVLAITILWVVIITTGLPVSFAHGIIVSVVDLFVTFNQPPPTTSSSPHNDTLFLKELLKKPSYMKRFSQTQFIRKLHHELGICVALSGKIMDGILLARNFIPVLDHADDKGKSEK
uniref:G-protein coupled receptors family 1 profile domain-containing protein n=1 Tax=Anopheles stephensi TaxID=30069 RepID=A0A182XW94_ANOST